MPIAPTRSFLTLLLAALAFTGCAFSPSATPTPATGATISGKAFGGQQPLVGSHVYLMAANSGVFTPNTSGYGNQSVSLLTTAATGYSDAIGAYVPTGSDGSFNITGDYTCPSATTQTYLYALGGNPGAGVNSAAGFLAVLGPCGSLSASTYVWINEVSTVAAAFAIAGFATDATHVSSSGTPLAQTGIANAFANAANLAALKTGAALATTPAGNGTVPQATINTLANILAACVNSPGPGSSNCTTLLSNTLSNGATGTMPTDTATAAINIAHNPGANVAALYGSPAPTSPFSPTLSAQPNDFTLALSFTGGGIGTQGSAPTAIAIDSAGGVWIAGGFGHFISRLSSTGAALSPSTGYTGGGIYNPDSIAIDSSGNAWIANHGNASISEFSSTGTALSPSTGYTGGGLDVPESIAIDGSGNVWAANAGNNTVSEFSSAGSAISSSTGYIGGGLNEPFSIAIDGAGNAWIADYGASSISKFSSAGTALSSSAGYTGGGLDNPNSIAIDGSGNAWTTSLNNSTVSKFSSAGAALSPSSGFASGGLGYPLSLAIDGAANIWVANDYTHPESVSELSNAGAALSPSIGYTGGVLEAPFSVAVDGSGNVWVADSGTVTVIEIIGAATPVITPVCAGLPSTPTSDGSSNLGSRP